MAKSSTPVLFVPVEIDLDGDSAVDFWLYKIGGCSRGGCSENLSIISFDFLTTRVLGDSSFALALKLGVEIGPGDASTDWGNRFRERDSHIHSPVAPHRQPSRVKHDEFMLPSARQYISLPDAAQYVDYHPDYLAALCRNGELEVRKVGRNRVTTRSVLESFIARKHPSRRRDHRSA